MPAINRLVLAIATAAAALGSFAPGVLAANPTPEDAVLAAMPAVVAHGSPAFLFGAIDETGAWSAAVGVSGLKDGTPATADMSFRIGSVSKMFVAVAVLQLVAAGKVGLDTPVSAYLPGLLARGDDITIRMLLQHRSGLGTTPFGNDRGNTWYSAIKTECRSPLDPISVIKAADVQLFEPGTAFNYANAGYTTLGLVIERVTGRPYAEIIHDGILEPLGLTHTGFSDDMSAWPAPILQGYGDFQPGSKLHRNVSDETACNMSMFGAAGSGISTTHDLTIFMHALTHGGLLPGDLYRQMIDTLPVPGAFYEYGLGIIRESTHRCGGTVVLLGHDGLVFGYQTLLMSTTDGTRTFANVVNIAPGPDSLWPAVQAADTAELCTPA